MYGVLYCVFSKGKKITLVMQRSQKLTKLTLTSLKVLWEATEPSVNFFFIKTYQIVDLATLQVFANSLMHFFFVFFSLMMTSFAYIWWLKLQIHQAMKLCVSQLFSYFQPLYKDNCNS